jgi:opacity protein-like surface antigen
MSGGSVRRWAVLVLTLISVISSVAQKDTPPGETALPPTDESRLGETAAGRPEKVWKLRRGSKEINFEFGFAPMQPTFFSGHKEYDTDGRKFATGSFKWGRVIGTAKGVTYEYFFEVIPVSFALKNEVTNPGYVSRQSTPNRSKTVRENTYGIGIEPAGFKFIFRPRQRLKPFVRLGAGFIFTNKPIPVPESPNYNFIGDFGGGLMYSLTENQTIDFGYRYFHISNMNIGEINPGYNANIFYVGFSRFYK